MSVSDRAPTLRESASQVTGRDLRPPSYRRHPAIAILTFAALVTLLAVNVHGHYGQGLLVDWLLLCISSVGFYLVFGLGGQFAFSQAMFYGLGAYTSAWATRGHLDPTTGHVTGGNSFIVGIVAAIVVSVIVAFVFAVIVRRTNQFYFAIGTLALSFMGLTVFQNWMSYTNGGEVANITPIALGSFTIDTDLRRFGLALVVLAIVLGLVAAIERSPLRREFIALRDNEEVAATVGSHTMRLRYLAFVLGSAIAAVSGALYANMNGSLTLDTFGIELGIDIFLVVLLGGIGSMWGAVLGAAFVVWVPTKLGFVGSHEGLVYGILLIVVMIFAPKGLIGLVSSGWDKLRARRTRPGPNVDTRSASQPIHGESP